MSRPPSAQSESQLLLPGFDKITRRALLENSQAAQTLNVKLLSLECLMLSQLRMMCGWELFGGVQALGGEITSTLWSLRRGRATALILTFSRNMSKRISVARRRVCRLSSCIYFFFWLRASEKKSAEEILVCHILALVHIVCTTHKALLWSRKS